MVHDYTASLVSRKEVAPNIFHISFKLQDDGNFVFAPGQYLLLKVKDQYRQFSISVYKESVRTFDLIIEYFENGLASEYLKHLKIGELSEFKGPAGIFVQHEVARSIIYLATGTGVAPILTMINSVVIKNRTHPMFLFWGLPTKKDVYLEDQLRNWSEKNQLFRYAICLSKEKSIITKPLYKGHIQDNIKDIIGNTMLSNCDVYICGGKDAVVGLKEYALDNRVDAQRLYFERFN